MGNAREVELAMKYFDIYPNKGELDNFIYNLLRKWHLVIRRYEEKWVEVWKLHKDGKGYLPFVYNEEAQVGLLAIAAREAGCYPFVQFDQDKKTKSGRGKQDLEIITSEGCIWSIEAKYLGVNWSHQELDSRVRERLQAARKDTRKLVHRHLGRSLALLFLRPYNFPPKNEVKVFVEQFGRFKGLVARGRADFAAMHMCQEHILRSSNHPDSPGIVIIGRYIYD